MKRFLLLALTAGLISPIAANAEDWRTINSWVEGPDTLFATGTTAFQIDLDMQVVDDGIIYSQGRYLPVGKAWYAIQVECDRTRLWKGKLTQPIVHDPVWVIRREGKWYYDDNQPDYPFLSGKPAYEVGPEIEKLMSGENPNETDDAIIQSLCNK